MIMEKQIFKVGGAVRDYLMGKTASDNDYVVVGSTVEDMLAAGYMQVGEDFPVFIHPETKDEYALARTERKSGQGYKGFETKTDGVTLEDDLRRRDLTINAIASTITNIHLGIWNYIDPFGGIDHIKSKTLMHVNTETFKEDPLRVLRLARFCAKFPDFNVEPSTVKLCRDMVESGELSHLVAERVWKETEKALGCAKPSRYFVFLKMIGALKVIFPEIDALVDVPAGPYTYHPEGDAFVHTMMVLDQATDTDVTEVMRFAALVHDLGKGRTPKDILPHHYGHEAGGVAPLMEMVDRLKIPNEYWKTAKVVVKYHTHVHNTFKLNIKTFVKVFEDIHINNEIQFRDLVDILVHVSQSDARGRGSFYEKQPYKQAAVFFKVMMDMAKVKARDLFTEEELKAASVGVIKDRLYKARLAAAKAALSK